MQEKSMNQTKSSLKPFFVIWSGQSVSLLGSQLVQFALIWWLTQTTGSATVLAMASLVGLVPQVVLGPFVGVLVDRWSRRYTMLLADSSVALATLVLAYLYWIDVAQIWHIFVILFIRALAGSFHWPAMQSSTSLMVPEEHLTRIQGLNQTMQGGLNIASAPLGALLLGIMPIQGILAIDVVTAVFAIVPLFFVPIPQPSKRAKDGDTAVPQTSFGTDLREGLRYAWSWPGMMLIMGMATLINLVLTPAFTLLPLLITNHFGGSAIQLGGIEATFGVGIVVGGLLLGTWGGFKRRILTTLTGLIGMGIATVLIGLAPANLFVVAIVGAFGVGAMQAIVNGPIQAIFQAAVEPEMQGRMFTLIGSLAAAMSPFGLIIAGPVADALGVRTWYIVGGCVTLLMGIVGFFIPAALAIEAGHPNKSTPQPSNETTETAVPLPVARTINL
ncbi:MAG: MFS transporter [Anaerolineales bacterium]|nr:MFS transporter [Anaerolineales bacterium]MCA9978992.1 MFS transporter [Anaerolineales bacterium]